MGKIKFQKSRPFSLGVELEFQIVDKESFNLVPRAPEILKHFVDTHEGLVASEFLQCIIEVQTSVCDSIDHVEEDLRRSVGHVEDIAASYNSFLFSSSLHPFANPNDQKITKDLRYERIMDELQLVGRQFISQGMHVHIGMINRETAVKVWNILQAYLPLFLSLSASSPYFKGEDTGLCSYRTKLFEALPLAGIVGNINNWQQYENEVQMLITKGVIRAIHDLWWDIRLSPGLGTVEIRICDIPSRYSDILALTAFIQAMVVFISEQKIQLPVISQQLLKYNKWQAARYGLEGWFHDPLGMFFQEKVKMITGVRQLVDILEPTIKKMSSERRCDQLMSILENGTSCQWQRNFMKKNDSFQKMIKQLHSEFWT